MPILIKRFAARTCGRSTDKNKDSLEKDTEGESSSLQRIVQKNIFRSAKIKAEIQSTHLNKNLYTKAQRLIEKVEIFTISYMCLADTE